MKKKTLCLTTKKKQNKKDAENEIVCRDTWNDKNIESIFLYF